MDKEDDFYDVILAPMKDRMLRAVWRLVRNPQLVEDTLQDALATIWRNRERIRAHSNPQALVLKITADVSCDALRKGLRRQQREQPVSAGDTAIQPPDPPADPFETAQMERTLRRAVAVLPEKQAAAVLLRIIHDEPFSSIAQALGCSESTARIHFMRAKARLKRMLKHSFAPGPRARGARK